MGDVIELRQSVEVRCTVISKELWFALRQGEYVVLGLPRKGEAIAFALTREAAREIGEELLALADEDDG